MLSEKVRTSGSTNIVSAKMVVIWLRTNGVDTNQAAAKVVLFFVRLGEKVRPGTYGKIQVGLTGVPKKSLCQKA